MQLMSKIKFQYFYLHSEKSFDDIDLWLRDLKTNASPDIKIFLIGNKADLEECRKIPKDQAEKFKDEYELDLFMETSAKIRLNAQEIFVEAANLLYKDYTKYKKRISLPSKESKTLLKLENEKFKKDKCC